MFKILLFQFITLWQEVQLTSTNEREDKLNDLVNYIHEWREATLPYRTLGFRDKVRHRSPTNALSWFGERHGSYFLMSVAIVKALYLVNTCVQFTLLNDFLGTDFELFGVGIIDGLASGKHDSIKPSPRFPFVTMCDFQLRHLQNVQTWTLQCVIPINLFNEKIFVCIWFWSAIVCALSAINLLLCLCNMAFPARRTWYIKKLLKLRQGVLVSEASLCTMSGKSDKEKIRMLKIFIDTYLKFDGVFVIRIAAHTGSDILAAQLVEKLYLKFKDTSEQATRNGDDKVVTVKYQEA